MSKEYRMAVALLQFKSAFMALAAASKEMPDLDVSENYPFYLLDYEEIAPAVSQWCSIHAARLMQALPERVDNPACISCLYYRAGLLPSGLCKGAEKKRCHIHPTIVYSREAVTPYLLAQEVKVAELDDSSIHLLYMRKADEAYEGSTKDILG